MKSTSKSNTVVLSVGVLTIVSWTILMSKGKVEELKNKNNDNNHHNSNGIDEVQDECCSVVGMSSNSGWHSILVYNSSGEIRIFSSRINTLLISLVTLLEEKYLIAVVIREVILLVIGNNVVANMCVIKLLV